MRVAVVEFTGRSGMIHYAFQLCRGLSEAGANVTLVTDRRYELARVDAPFEVERLFDLWDPKPRQPGRRDATRSSRALQLARRAWRGCVYYRQWARLRAYLDRTQPHLVQFGDIRFPGDLLPLAAIRRAGHRMVDVCHNVHPYAAEGRDAGSFHSGPAHRFVYRQVYRQFDHVAVHHEVNRLEFLATYGLDPRHVSSIPHGNELLFGEMWDPRKDERMLRERLELEPGSPVVLLFGTLSRYKGADLLLRAFARLHGRMPAARLVIAGYPMGDFDLDEHRRLARRMGVAGAVRFHPAYVPSDEVVGWMRLATVAAYPYRTLYQSGAVQVALAAGVPVVASRVGAMGEVIRPGIEGLLVPPGDVDALAQALERVLTDTAAATAMGRAGRESARVRFGWKGIGEKLLATYEAVLARRFRSAA